MLQLYKAINLSYKGEQWENIRLSLEPAEKLAVEGITMKKRDAFLFCTKLSTFEAILGEIYFTNFITNNLVSNIIMTTSI